MTDMCNSIFMNNAIHSNMTDEEWLKMKKMLTRETDIGIVQQIIQDHSDGSPYSETDARIIKSIENKLKKEDEKDN